MLKEKIKNKETKIERKKKSKSINNRNISKNRFKTKKLSVYGLSYNSNNNNNKENININKNKNESNLNLFINKGNSRIEIDSNKGPNIKNIKRNLLKKDDKKLEEMKLKEIENKENIFNGNNINIKPTNIYSNNYNKKKQYKFYYNKNNNNNKEIKKNENKIFSERIKDNELKGHNLNNKQIKEEKNNDMVLINKNIKEENIQISEKINLEKEKKNDNIINEKNKENKNKYLDNIIKEINISYNIDKNNKNENNEIKENSEIKKQNDNINNNNINNKSIKKEIKNTPKKDKPILKLNSEKSENKNIENENENEKSKQKTLLLKLDSATSSSNEKNSKSVSYPKGIITNSDYSESSYESEVLQINGKMLIKNKKTDFLNNIKKCLFNKVSNIKKISNEFNSISNSNINTDEEDLKFKKLINIQKRKTAEFSNIYKINLKQNISFTESEINELKIKIKSSKITQPGLNDNKIKTNQDSYLILENIFNQKLNIYGIFDGHGDNGHLISDLISKFLSQYFTNKKNFVISHKNNSQFSNSESSSDSDSLKSEEIEINSEKISEIFENNNFIENTINKLVEKSNECNFNLDFSGTTCTLLFLIENKIICSNIGDSQCVLFNCSNQDRWTYEIISIIHKPDEPKEKQRILEMGGEIHPYYDENGIYEGPNRIYAKNKAYPGLCLSRSIGDLIGEEIGIISEPDIIIKNIDSTCKYIILGSDGLWDMIKPYDANRIVNPYFNRGDPDGACKALLKKATKNWEKDGSERDDITIIVIFFGLPNKIKS